MKQLIKKIIKFFKVPSAEHDWKFDGYGFDYKHKKYSDYRCTICGKYKEVYEKTN